MNRQYAIETVYDGCRFRSRLEAKFAVFFKHAGIPYQYEPEAFDFDGVLYLPDFWLPSQAMWAEVKPRDEQTEEAHEKLRLLATGTGHPACFLDFNSHWLEVSGGFVYQPGNAEHDMYIVTW